MAKDTVLTLFEDLKARVFRVSDQSVPGANDQFIFSLMPVGIPIAAKDFANPWQPTAGGGGVAASKESQQALYNLSQLVNAKLAIDGTGRVMQGASAIHDTWNLILTSAAPIKKPPPPNEEMKKRVEAAQKLLYRPSVEDPDIEEKTALQKAYDKFKLAFLQAELDYAGAYSEAMRTVDGIEMWPIIGKVHLSKLETARDEFNKFGHKEQVEAANDTIAAQGRDAIESIIASAKKKFNPWQLTLNAIAQTSPYVQVFPSNWADPKAIEGWTRYTFGQKDIRDHHEESTTSWGGGASVSWGFWSIGGHADSTTTEVHDTLTEQGLEIDLTYAIAQIQRPWLSSILLSVDGWMLVGQDKGVVSDGTVTQQAKPAKAFWLPALPTQMLLVKNVKILTVDTQNTYDYIRTHVEGGARFGWGFFSVGGSYTRDTLTTNSTFHLEDGWIIIDGVQVIGWVSEVMPYSPPESGLGEAGDSA